jgi:hypothetical protein
MTNRESEQPTITWTSKKVWGSVGLTHYGRVTLGVQDWKLTIDQPQRGDWAIRGWRDGAFILYGEAPTLAEAKLQAEARMLYITGRKS